MENKKNNYKTVWEKAYTYLNNKLPEHAIGAWFEPLKPLDFSDNEILLEVPNQFFCEWIDSHYKKFLLSSLNQGDSSQKINYRFKR